MKIFQGDIAYVKVNEEQFAKLLNGKEFSGKKVKENFVIAHSESGNHHTITAEKQTDTIEVMDLENGIFAIKINGSAVINHEKYKPTKILKQGLWFASRKTEYNPVNERLVSD